MFLYPKHIDAGKDNKSAIKAAARDLGWLVKTVLSEDKRTFEAGKGGLPPRYTNTSASTNYRAGQGGWVCEP